LRILLLCVRSDLCHSEIGDLYEARATLIK